MLWEEVGTNLEKVPAAVVLAVVCVPWLVRTVHVCSSFLYSLMVSTGPVPSLSSLFSLPFSLLRSLPTSSILTSYSALFSSYYCFLSSSLLTPPFPSYSPPLLSSLSLFLSSSLHPWGHHFLDSTTSVAAWLLLQPQWQPQPPSLPSQGRQHNEGNV